MYGVSNSLKHATQSNYCEAGKKKRKQLLFVLPYAPSGDAEITCFLWILFNTELITPRHTLLHLHAFHSHLNTVTFPHIAAHQLLQLNRIERRF